MHRRVPILVLALPAVLALALASRPAAAQQQDSTRSAQGIRAFLSVKEWFVDFTVELDVQRGAQHYHALTKGIVGLDMRNQGPAVLMKPQASPLTPDQQRRAISNPGSLTPAQLQALAQSSAAYLEQIDNSANWERGPESMPEAQDPDDPRWQAWLDSTGLDRTVDYQASTDDFRQDAHGTGRVFETGQTRFEVDVAQKKFVVGIPVQFGDTKRTIHAVHVVEQRKEEHGWVTTTSEHGLTGGIDPTFSRIVPEPWNLGNAYAFEGTLPNAVGPVSGSQVFDVDTNTGQFNGKLKIAWTVSPERPQPVELVIQKPQDYDKWRPLGLDEEDETGNTIAVKAVLRKPGGGDPPFKASRITFKLLNTSRIPGVCMNYPRLPANPPPPDLLFELSRNRDFLQDDYEGQSISLTGPDATEATAVISSRDYGGHAALQVTAELTNGDVVVGTVEGTNGERSLRLPSRPEDSHVADVYLDAYHAAGEADDSDVDDEPVGDGFKGDGLTLFEEYRGFFENGEWIETDPSIKDYFIRNKCSGHGPSMNGIRMFETLSEFDVHEWLLDTEMRTDGQINFNHGAEAHVVDQHGITIVPTDEPRRPFANVDHVGTPGTARMLHMPQFTWPTFAGWMQSGNTPGRRTEYYAVTMAHELMHAANVFHHGESDGTVTWRVVSPPLLDPYMSENGFTHKVTVKHEDGALLDLAVFGPDEKEIYLGSDHGQHSGNEDCVMRYDCSWGYVSKADPNVRYTCSESIGTGLCTSIVGTGVNAAGRSPQPRYSNAAGNRGNCRGQLRVNDLGEEPHR